MWRLFFRDQSARISDFGSHTARADVAPDRTGLQYLGVIFGCVTATVTALAIITVIQQV
jgi:hypothetical protein